MSLLKSKKSFYLSKEPMGGTISGIYYKKGAFKNEDWRHNGGAESENRCYSRYHGYF
jgi:hypothetical protein